MIIKRCIFTYFNLCVYIASIFLKLNICTSSIMSNSCFPAAVFIYRESKKEKTSNKKNSYQPRTASIFPYFLGIWLPLYTLKFIYPFICGFLMCVCMWLHREAERGMNFWAVHFNGKKTQVIQEQLLSTSSRVCLES